MRNANGDGFYTPHTNTHTHAHLDHTKESGQNKQGVPGWSIHALLVPGCLQHKCRRSWHKNTEPVVWWVTAGVSDHLCSGLHCFSCWRVSGIAPCVWKIGSLTNVPCEETKRRFMDKYLFLMKYVLQLICGFIGRVSWEHRWQQDLQFHKFKPEFILQGFKLKDCGWTTVVAYEDLLGHHLSTCIK